MIGILDGVKIAGVLVVVGYAGYIYTDRNSLQKELKAEQAETSRLESELETATTLAQANASAARFASQDAAMQRQRAERAEQFRAAILSGDDNELENFSGSSADAVRLLRQLCGQGGDPSSHPPIGPTIDGSLPDL